MRILTAALVLSSCVVPAFAEKSKDFDHYEKLSDSLLGKLTVSVTLPGSIFEEEKPGDKHEHYKLRPNEFFEALGRSLPYFILSGLTRNANGEAIVHVFLDETVREIRVANWSFGISLSSSREVEEVKKKLRRYRYTEQTTEKSHFESMQVRGQSHKDGCPQGDVACQALQLAFSQARQHTLTLATYGKQQEGSQCTGYQEPAYAEVTYSCLEQLVLDGSMVANSETVFAANVNAPFVHLGGFEGEQERETQLFANYQLDFPDLVDYRSVQLVLQSPSNVLMFAVNEMDVPLGSVPQKPICYSKSHPGCALEVGSLRAGVELVSMLRAGKNYFSLVQQGPRSVTDGILLRLVRADAPPSGSLDSCQAKLAPNCAFTETTRCLENIDGVCLRRERSYSCRTLQVAKPDEKCARKKCQGPNCPGRQAIVANADVNEMLAKLEAFRQMAVYMTNDSYEVFAGAEGTCRSKIAWGLGNCCKSSGDRTTTTNAVALAQLGVTHVIRGVSSLGSPHTYDVLFQADDIAGFLGNIGHGALGSALSPSLSYYGLSVSSTSGALSFGFDPASFGVAVALAVVANLLKCEKHEQAMGVKLGAGLCHETRRWCSSRRFFFCKERTKSFCCFNSRLAKLINRQGLAQLVGLSQGCASGGCSQNPYTNQLANGGGSCRGLSHDELRDLDFTKIDLSSLIGEFTPEFDPGNYQRYLQDNLDGIDAAVNITSALVPPRGR